MKELTKDMLRSTLISVGMAMAIFCFVGIVFDVSNGGSFSIDGYRFTKMVTGCLIIGLGFGIPSIVYKKDNLPMPARIIIHMGIGCTIYTIVAYAVGWFGGVTVGKGIIIVCIQLGVAFVLWGIFFRHYKNQADEINKRIKEMNSEKP